MALSGAGSSSSGSGFGSSALDELDAVDAVAAARPAAEDDDGATRGWPSDHSEGPNVCKKKIIERRVKVHGNEY